METLSEATPMSDTDDCDILEMDAATIGFGSASREENDGDEAELRACVDAEFNVSPSSVHTPRPPHPAPLMASPVPLLLDTPPSPPRAYATRPIPRRAQPPTPMAGPRYGFWRVGGYTAQGCEILVYHPHTHTPIIKPHTQRSVRILQATLCRRPHGNMRVDDASPPRGSAYPI